MIFYNNEDLFESRFELNWNSHSLDLGPSWQFGQTFYGSCVLVRVRSAILSSLVLTGVGTATFGSWLK